MNRRAKNLSREFLELPHCWLCQRGAASRINLEIRANSQQKCPRWRCYQRSKKKLALEIWFLAEVFLLSSYLLFYGQVSVF
jgi:hypothetical protein